MEIGALQPSSASEPSQDYTAADAQVAIESWSDLTASRRRALATAVGLLKRALGRPLEAIRLEAESVARALDATTAAACNVTEPTFKAYRSSLRYVLRRLGLLSPRRRPASHGTISAVWAELLARASDRFLPLRLMPLAAFCSERDLPPEGVTVETIASFLQQQKTADIKGTARATVLRTVGAWNSAVERVPGWPQQKLVAPPAQPRCYSLPFEACGEKLATDVASFKARLRPASGEGNDSLYNSKGPLLDLRPATIRTHLDSLRLAAAALVHSGTPPGAIDSLATLVELENAKRIMDWHFKRSGKRRTATMRNIANALTIVARHHVGLRGEELEAVLAALKRAKPPKQREITSRNAALLRQLEDPRRQARLLHLPNRLLRFAARLRDGGVGARGVECAERPKEAAWLASVAAAIEIELHCPLRLENLANLRIGVHLQSADGRAERFTHIVVEPEEVKNRRRIDWALQASTSKLLGRYLREFRPALARPGSDWLFPSRDSAHRPRSKGGLTIAIERAVHEHVGVRLNTHAFRCFAGAMILADNPHAIDDLREVLGHKGFETALVHYRAVASREASRRMNRIVANKRRATSMIAAGAFARLDRSLRRKSDTPSPAGPMPGQSR